MHLGQQQNVAPESTRKPKHAAHMSSRKLDTTPGTKEGAKGLADPGPRDESNGYPDAMVSCKHFLNVRISSDGLISCV